MKTFPWRPLLSLVFGGLLAILVAANWPDPNDAAAGVVTGEVCTFGGFIAGLIWQEIHDSRQGNDDAH